MRDFSPLSWLTLSIVASCSGRVDLESRNATGAEGGADASSSTGDTTLSNPVVIATGLIEPVLLASDGATLFINTSVPMGPLLTSVPVEGGAMWRFQVVSLFRTRGRRGADFAKL